MGEAGSADFLNPDVTDGALRATPHTLQSNVFSVADMLPVNLSTVYLYYSIKQRDKIPSLIKNHHKSINLTIC